MSSNKAAKTGLSTVEFDPARYKALLAQLIGVAETLQNNPAQDLIPREDNASDFILAALAPYSGEGGPLTVERVSFTEGRGNLIITYKGTASASSPGSSIGFVGSHLDVVPANPETWKRDPFKLTIEGDELHGRGTTDCLGHAALLTELMLELAIKRPALLRTVTVVMICNEENGMVEGIGVDKLMSTGKMDMLKNGPVIWVDCADSQPCLGTCGSLTWTLRATGKLFHSGIPQKGVNAIELANAALAEVQHRFYKDFPSSELEAAQGFITPSTMKPTQYKVAAGSLNQLPPWAEISGDVRLTPFYEVSDLQAKVEGYVAELNANLGKLPTFGPVSKYEIEGFSGSLEFSWGSGYMEGVACSLDSEGNKALVSATEQVLGEAKPYSIGGSLPLVRSLKREGFDLQMTGFGLMSTYHADNEFCKLSDMEKGFNILRGVIGNLEP